MSELRFIRGKDFTSAIEHGLTLVDFVAHCAPPSKRRESMLLEILRLHGKSATVARVDLDSNPGLVGKLGLVVLPALVLFLDGVPQWWIFGDVSSEQFQNISESILLDSPYPDLRSSINPLLRKCAGFVENLG